MAASRVQCLRRLLREPREVLGGVLPVLVSGSRLLSTESTGDREAKVVGKELAMMRREYEKQMSELRKKYAAEEERKRKEKRQVELVTRERIAVEKEKRLAIKKEKSEIRAVEVAEEIKALRARLVSFLPGLTSVGSGVIGVIKPKRITLKTYITYRFST